MDIFFLFIITLLGLFEIKRVKFFLNPLSVFLFEWSIIILFSKIALYGLFETSSSIYTLIYAGIFSFVGGYYLKYFLNTRIKFTIFNNYNNYIIRYKIVTFLSLICFIYYLLYLYIIFSNINEFNLKSIQFFLRQSNEIFSNKWIRAIGAFIIEPVTFALPMISISNLFFGDKNKLFAINTFIVLIIKSLATASRMTILFIFIYIMIAFVFILKTYKNIIGNLKINKVKKYIILVFAISVISFAIMSLSRGLPLVRNFYLQISIPPKMFETWKEEVDKLEIYGYGEASLNGFLFPLIYFFQKIIGFDTLPDNFEKIYNLINLTDSHWVLVGNNITANAYVSIFWFLYLDFRILGILIGMFLFGLFCSNSFKNMWRRFNTKSFCIYLACMVAIILSLVRIQFTSSMYCISLIFIYFFAFKGNKAMEGTQA